MSTAQRPGRSGHSRPSAPSRPVQPAPASVDGPITISAWAGHVVVCGLHGVGLRIVERLHLAGVRVVVVDDAPDQRLATCTPSRRRCSPVNCALTCGLSSSWQTLRWVGRCPR
jgi:hypothetical protein